MLRLTPIVGFLSCIDCNCLLPKTNVFKTLEKYDIMVYSNVKTRKTATHAIHMSKVGTKSKIGKNVYIINDSVP